MYASTPAILPGLPTDVQPPPSKEEAKEEYGSWVGYCMTVNYILGVGVLGIPWAFDQGGYILSPLVLGIVSLAALVTAFWLPEVSARAEGLAASSDLLQHDHLAEYQRVQSNRRKLLLNSSSAGDADADAEHARLVDDLDLSDSQHHAEPVEMDRDDERGSRDYSDLDLDSDRDSHSSLRGPAEPVGSVDRLAAEEEAIRRNVISHSRKFEVSELCGMFLGNKHRIVYEACVSCYMLGALWSYAAVFAGSFASHVAIPFLNGGDTCDIDKDHSSACHGLYLFYLALFSCVAVPLTCAELNEQKIIQVTLAIFRFVAMTVMITTSVAAIASYPNEKLPQKYRDGDAPFFSDTPAWSWAGLPKLLPIAVYSQIFHHSAPGLIMPLKDKAHVKRVFGGVLFTTFMFYNMVGISIALFYGSSVNETCSLSWAHYKGSHLRDTPGWASFISYLVVLFPPMDIISAFPLNAFTLANNWTCRVLDRRQQKLRIRRLPFRVASSVVPIVGACFVSNLATILRWTGCVGIIIAFLYPALLQYASITRMRTEFGEYGFLTQYSSWWSLKRSIITALFIFSCTTLILVLVFNGINA